MNSRAAAQAGDLRPGAARAAWFRLMRIRLGVVPLPVHLLLLALVICLSALHRINGDLTLMIAILAAGGYSCGEIGRHIPLLNRIGGGSLATIFVPSFLIAHGMLPRDLVTHVAAFSRTTSFIYLFIAAVVGGSILCMDRRTLMSGFVRIALPLAAGSVAAVLAAGLVGAMLGIGFAHAILFVAVPVMAGGVGEGAIPLAVGYAQVAGVDRGAMIGQILPLVFFGNLIAMLICGVLDQLGRLRPALTGNGRLQRGPVAPRVHADGLPATLHAPTTGIDIATVAAGGITAVMLYCAGMLAFALTGLPSPVAMLLLSVGAKLLDIVPPEIEEGARVVSRFFVIAVTYPLLFATAVAFTPWSALIAAFHPAILATVIATVAALVGAGFLTARLAGLHPIDTAIVNACHSGLGGTGDVMILTASNRLELMPFAQVATRIGGAATVMLALVAMAHLHVR